jgi:integrase
LFIAQAPSGHHNQVNSFALCNPFDDSCRFANLDSFRMADIGEMSVREPSPTFSAFAKRFLEHVKSRHENKPQTVQFYTAKLGRLLEYPPITNTRLDRIDEGAIEGYVVARRATVGPATVNRELATLRRMLRLAHEWREIQRVPRIRLLPGGRVRDFVLSRKQEQVYLAACPQPLKDIAVLMLETGLRIGEALHLEWPDVTLSPVNGSRFGYLPVREGKSKNAQRIIPLTDRAAAMLRERKKSKSSGFAFASREGKPYLGTSMNHLHRNALAPIVKGKRRPLFAGDFVLHSLRHTMLTRLGESGVDAFTIMRIAGHSSIVVSQRYIHPTPEAVERAFERLQLSGDFAVIEPKRLPPATVSATLTGTVAVSH